MKISRGFSGATERITIEDVELTVVGSEKRVVQSHRTTIEWDGPRSPSKLYAFCRINEKPLEVGQELVFGIIRDGHLFFDGNSLRWKIEEVFCEGGIWCANCSRQEVV